MFSKHLGVFQQPLSQTSISSPPLNPALGPPKASPKLPIAVTATIIAICVLPILLNMGGVSFASNAAALDGATLAQLLPREVIEHIHRSLAGSYTHTILEWSAFCTAIFTVILAFAHFKIKQDVITPILGIALLCAGVMDAFHTLAADRLIDAVADNQNLIPFTWALCRLFNALITMIGVSLFLVTNVGQIQWKRSSLFVITVSSSFILLAYLTIQICANTAHLPQTTFPNAVLTRPWDVIPLILFLISGIWLYPKFYRKHPSLFSHALIISAVPNIVTQAHMAFGSTALFDNHFNIAHFLKIITYLVPLAGLVLDYIHTHEALEQRNQEFVMEIQERKATERTLQKTLKDLKDTQVQLIQTEKMSGLGHMVSGVAHEINNPVNFIHGNLTHLDEYITDLLGLTRLYQQAYPNPTDPIQDELNEIDLAFLEEDAPKLLDSMKLGTGRIRDIVKSLRTFSRVDEANCKQTEIHESLDSTLVILQSRIMATAKRPPIEVIRHYGTVPLIECYAGELNQVFMHLLANGIDAIDARYLKGAPALPARLTIRTQLTEDRQEVIISIKDNGIGMAPDTLRKIFDPFFTTKPVGQGTGLGLAVSHQIITEHHNGTLTCTSVLGEGTDFHIQIPVCRGLT